MDEALELLREHEKICRQSGNDQGLATGLANQALILHDDLGDRERGQTLGQHALDIANRAGLADVVRDIRASLPFLGGAES